MADKKDYWTQEAQHGNVRISEDVIASIAAVATAEVEGVSALQSGIGSEIVEMLSKKASATKGVKIQLKEDAVTVEISFAVKYGNVVIDVAKKVQEQVTAALESMTGLKVEAVNVLIGGINFEKAEPKAQPKTESVEDSEQE